MSLDSPSYRAALAEWKSALPPEAVVESPDALARAGRSTAGRPNPPAAILYPRSTAEVVAVTQIAHRHRVPLHPISRGRNWGYGDACAPGPGQVLVDLSRMNRIHEVNSRLGYAVIEPGVSQGQLHRHLVETRSGLWMDSTGAGPEASLVGNLADRGFGHTRYGDHFLSSGGMEVVLADGRVLNTGFGHYQNARARWIYRYGVGPVLDGLFSQSNFGIITRIGLWLMPEPEAFSTFFFSSPHEDAIEEMVDRLAPLKTQGLLQSAVHLANDLRAFSGKQGYPWARSGGVTPLPPELRCALREESGIGAWNGCGAITGTRELVRAIQKRLRQTLRPYGPVFLDDRKLAVAGSVVGALNSLGIARSLGQKLAVVRPIHRMLKGEPVIEPLQGASWRVRPEPADSRSSEGPLDPLESGAGLLWVSPVVPMVGEETRALLKLLEPIYSRHGFEMLVTFTLLTERAMCCVTNVSFDRRIPEEAARALACYDELMGNLMSQGYIPYRTGPGGFNKLRAGSSVFWDVTAELKQALDPRGILSPGRYQPK